MIERRLLKMTKQIFHLKISNENLFSNEEIHRNKLNIKIIISFKSCLRILQSNHLSFIDFLIDHLPKKTKEQTVKNKNPTKLFFLIFGFRFIQKINRLSVKRGGNYGHILTLNIKQAIQFRSKILSYLILFSSTRNVVKDFLLRWSVY